MKKRSRKSRRTVVCTETAWVKNVLYSILCGCMCLLAACRSHGKADADQYALKASDTQLAFPLDDATKIYIYSMQAYTNPDGEEYLVFQNERYLQLLVYNMNTQKLLKKINCIYQGPEAVPRFSGFFMRNKNEIYVTHSNYDGVTLIDGEGKSLKTYKTKSKEGKGITTTSAVANELIQEIDNNLYIPLGINREYGEDVKFQKSNLCATLNLKTQKIEALPLTLFDIIKKEDENIFTMTHFRTTNGKQFIYSFEESEDIYVTDAGHTTLKKIKAKSKYLPPLQFKPHEVTMAGPDNCKSMEEPRYANILYDPYRKVYYRIAYPQVDIEKGINCFELSSFGGKNFSIMILNEDFEIIGETLMPDYTYNPFLCFVRQDGLYLSESHVLNPHFDENKLCFRRLELVKKK